jgi:hypothetical protein
MDWRGEVYTSKADGSVQGILYWKYKADGDEVWHIQQFIAQDGTAYMVDVISHPDKGK